MTPAAPVVEAPFAGPAKVRLYLAVALVAGAVIALQIGLMRVFAVGSWAHSASLVVSLAMLGFGLASLIMCLARAWFDLHWRVAAGLALLLVGPLTVAATLIAQELPFNPVFLVSDPTQKWRLLANFLLYFTPFFAAAFFLATVFLKSREAFGQVYFADLTGSGLAGLGVLAAMYVFPPELIITVPLLLWAFGGVLWFWGLGARRGLVVFVSIAVAAIAGYNYLPGMLGTHAIAVSPYKGVAYARNLPDAKRILSELFSLWRPGDLLQFVHAFRPWALRQCRVQPSRSAGQHLRRHVYRR